MSEASKKSGSGRGVWSRAVQAAEQTPDSRNRAVDFFRALSILAVISGHWLLAAPYVDASGLGLANLLETEPWVQWLTWGFQVMPVFFLVGGYANGVSWQAASRDGKRYDEWLAGRLQRLIGPVLPLIVTWALLGSLASVLGVAPEIIRVGSQVALVPIWFLAVYIVVVLLVPITYAIWQRFGFPSFWALGLAALINDALFFYADLRVLGFLNYFFVWLAVHQLGYAWRDGQFAGAQRTAVFAVAGAGSLIAMVMFGPYPISMVSVPGEPVSNTLPPKLPMLVLGIAQSGALIAMEGPVRRFLAHRIAWAGTILINGMIMTIYLWHITAAAVVLGIALMLGGIGLGVEPGSAAWWAVRPLWLLVYVVGLAAVVPCVGRFERGRRPDAPLVSSWRQVVGAALCCAGLALLALNGVGGDGWLDLRLSAIALPFVGGWLAGLLPPYSRSVS